LPCICEAKLEFVGIVCTVFSDGEQAGEKKKATERRNVVDISGERWLFLRR
jgi:hypothetical protein